MSGGANVLVNVAGLIRLALRNDFDVPLAVIAVAVVIIGVLAWSAAVVLPLRGAARLLERRRGGATMLVFAALFRLAGIFATATGFVFATVVAVLATLALLGAAAAGIRETRNSPSPIVVYDTFPGPLGRTPRTVKAARRLALFGGLVGAQAFYLKQAWKGMLSITLLALAFVSWDSPLVWVFAGALVGIVCLDFLGAPDRVETINGWL